MQLLRALQLSNRAEASDGAAIYMGPGAVSVRIGMLTDDFPFHGNHDVCGHSIAYPATGFGDKT
jgi:hypothetical protein